MIYMYKGFLFPFGIDERILEKTSGFLSRWTITGEYENGYACYDKYYRKPCFFTKHNGTSILVYDWKNQYEIYELARFGSTIFSTNIVKKASLIEIFPNRWEDIRIRLLYNGKTPMEIYFSPDGNILTPYGDKISSIEELEELTKHTPDSNLSLPRDFKIYKTFDSEKPYRIIHSSGQYFVVKKGYVQAHIPYGKTAPLSRIIDLLIST